MVNAFRSLLVIGSSTASQRSATAHAGFAINNKKRLKSIHERSVGGPDFGSSLRLPKAPSGKYPRVGRPTASYVKSIAKLRTSELTLFRAALGITSTCAL